MNRLKPVLIVTLRVTVITVIVAFCSVEVLIRFLSTTTSEGMTLYRGMPIRPLIIPVADIESDVDTYIENQDRTIFQYSSQLGWTFSEKFESDLIITNASGLRSVTDCTLENSEDIIRIAIFGDSFVAGGEVNNASAIPPLLEDTLEACGISAEVMNFGVFGYGMDQAYLRWQILGRDYNPDVVIIGFQPENLNRNVNLARPLAAPSDVPFTKPRYIIGEDDRLELINVPTVAPDELVNLYDNFDEWDYAPYEWHYNNRYTPDWRNISYIYRVIDARQNIELLSRLRLSPEDERVQIGYRIIEQFSEDVMREGSDFMILHLPNQPELRPYLSSGDFGYQFMIDELDSQYDFIHTENVFTSIDNSEWQPNLHYSPQTNQAVADYTADWLIDNIDDMTCSGD